MKFKDNEIRDIPPDINPLDDLTPLYREGKRKMVDEEDLSREIQQPQTQPQILSDEQSQEHGGEHDGEEYDERAAHNIKSIAVDFESMFYSPVGGAGCSYLPQ